MHPWSQCHIDLRWKSFTLQISSPRPEFIKYISSTRMVVAKPISCNLLFSLLWEWSKHWLLAEYHIHISQVSPQLTCGDTWKIYVWSKGSNSYFCKSKIVTDTTNSVLATTIPVPISTCIATITSTVQCWKIKSQGKKTTIFTIWTLWHVQTFIPSSINMIRWINYNIKQF